MSMSFPAFTEAPGPGPARRELKYVMAASYADAARAWLDHHAAPDPRFEHNVIRSLYFDTRGLEAWERKMASDFLKWKVRLRWYTDEAGTQFSDQAFLELKCKEGSVSRKTRAALDLDVAALDRDPFAAAKSLCLPAFLPLPAPGPLAPVAVISYRRRRYIEMGSGSRLALDQRIEAVAEAGGPFRRRACRLDAAVLEVKGPQAGGLPPALYTLQELTGARKQSFSKYGECVRKLLG
ncbi:MAG TPA: VTC domain-containing protein [Kiritimatiellia bacterium]|nr:VTC domain-containing protein [Kiritimatiellia bacterium]HSA18792.1 VTC domain-containing protein [Kiritimatiellia bacterium]